MKLVDGIWIIEPRTDEETVMDLTMRDATYIETPYDLLLLQLEKVKGELNG